jgi:hypothetical protein
MSRDLTRVFAILAPIVLLLPTNGSAQGQVTATPPDSGSRITNAGVERANAILDSVLLQRTHPVDTVDIGDFAAHMLARLDVPPFEDSLGFRVFADPDLIKIKGTFRDFPAESRAELGPIFTFIDSLTPFAAEIALTRGDRGVIRFRLNRVTVAGFPIPEIMLLPALREYNSRYPVLAQNGRELLIAMPIDALVKLVNGGVEIRIKPEAESEKVIPSGASF